MRVILVGAGAVGQVYGYHFARGGAEVTYVVRPHHVERLSDGMVLYPWNRKERTAPVHWDGYSLVTSVEEALAEPADVVGLCTSSTALLAADWFDRVAEHRGQATLLALNVGEEVPAFLRARVPDDAITWGLVSFAAWPAPLPGQDLPEPGMAWWVPWGDKQSYSGPDAARIAEVLRAGDLPTQVVDDVLVEVAFKGIVLSMVTLPLAIARWSLRDLAADRDLLALAHRGMQEVWAYAEQTTGERTPFMLRQLGPGRMALVLKYVFPLAPLDFEVFFRVHYTKIADQVTVLLDQRIAAIEGSGLPARALRALGHLLREVRRTTPIEAGPATLVPLGMRTGETVQGLLSETTALRGLGVLGTPDAPTVDALVHASDRAFEDGDLGLFVVEVDGVARGVAGFVVPEGAEVPHLVFGLPADIGLDPIVPDLADALRARAHARVFAETPADGPDLSPWRFARIDGGSDGRHRWVQGPPRTASGR